MTMNWDGSPDLGERRATTGARMLTVSDWKSYKQNTLQGFCTVTHPSGIIFHDVAIHQRGGSRWAAPPSKSVLKDGVQQKDANGKLRWQPVISFATKECKDRWSGWVLTALLSAYPDALS